MSPAGHVARALAGALLAALICGAMASVAAKEPVTIYGLAFPDEVAGAQRGNVRDYEATSPGLGYSVAYRRGDWTITVFIYDLRLTAIPDDPHSDLIKAQFDQAKGDVFRAQESGVYAKVEFRSDFTVPDARNVTRLLCGTFAFVHRSAGDVDSFLCVSSWKGKFVKLRITTPRSTWSEAEAKRMLDAWVTLLWPS